MSTAREICWHDREVSLLATGLAVAILSAGLQAQASTSSQQPAAQNPPAEPALPQPTYSITVIEAAPLPGVDVPLASIPAPVQTATGQDLERSGALDLSGFLNRRFNGVYMNEVQNNQFQPDVNYRGYTASPLLGTPQGLSVYMDGVRLNQPFGEVVSWDLIPRLAISSTTLMPGSNPLFGLNTLGGALALQTKDGLTARGTNVQAVYGSDTRRAVELEHGGQSSERSALVSRRKSLQRGRLARRVADRRPAGVRQDRMAACAARCRARHRFRRQRAQRQRTPGAGVSRPRLCERLHQAGHHRQPFDVRQRDDASPCHAGAHGFGERLLSRHPHSHVQRRHQRGLAGSVGVSADTRRTGSARCGRIHRIPDERRERVEYAVSVLAVHREHVVER